MFGQIDLGKGTAPQQTQQLVIAEELSHSLSHTTVLSMRKGGNIRRIQEHMRLTKACHAYHNTSMFLSDKRTQELVFVGALRKHDDHEKYKTPPLPRFRFNASLLQGNRISSRVRKRNIHLFRKAERRAHASARTHNHISDASGDQR